MANENTRTVTVQEMSELNNSLNAKITINNNSIANLQSDDDTEYTFTISSSAWPEHFDVSMRGALIKRKNGFFAISGRILITNRSLGSQLSYYEPNVKAILGNTLLSNVQPNENKSMKTYAIMTLNTTSGYGSTVPPKCCVCKVDASLATNGGLIIGIYSDTFPYPDDLDNYQKWEIFLPETTMIGTRENGDN